MTSDSLVPAALLSLDSADVQILLGVIWEARRAGLVPDCDADRVLFLESRIAAIENFLADD